MEVISEVTNLFKQQEPLLKDTATAHPTGPPSLNAWVPSRENSNIERERQTRDFFKPRLSPVDEIASTSLTGLSIYETEDDSVIGSRCVSATAPLSPAPYSAPLPSSPLLPDDATWFIGNPSSFSEYKSSGNNIKDTEDGILGASPLSSSHTNWSDNIHEQPIRFGPSVPGFNEGYQPMVGMSSSEWLRHYTNQQLGRASSQVFPIHHFYANEASRFDLYDRWGNPSSSNQMVYVENPQLNPGSPLIYGADEQRRKRFFHCYQGPSLYECGAFTDLRVEHPQLLQYLKEKDWQLQRQSQVRGPKYMGN